MRTRTLWVQALLFGVGCSYYDSALLEPQPVVDAAVVDAAATDAEADASACAHAMPPQKPSVVDAGGDQDLVLVLDWLTMSDRDLGYDLDKTCTCQGEGDSCQEPAWADADHCDGTDGRDNAVGALLQGGASMMPGFGEDLWNANLKAGRWGVLLRVRGYNGQPDDDRVELSWYMPDAFDAGPEDAGTPGGTPKWDGTDTWPIQSHTVEENDVGRPVWSDANAYVSDGVLVGQLPRGEMQASGSLRLVIRDAFVTGRLEQVQGVWRLRDGIVAGVWVLEDLFLRVANLKVQGSPLCKDALGYDVLKKAICRYADMYRSRGTPSSLCDSLSLAVTFTAIEGRLGPIVEVATESYTCSPGMDPANDSCDLP